MKADLARAPSRRNGARRTARVAVFGAGGHGKVVLDILLASGREVLGFIDGDPAKRGLRVNGFEVVGDVSALKGVRGVEVALGVGNNRLREKTCLAARALGLTVVSAIHPQAVVSPFARLSEAVALMPGAIVNSGCVLEEGAVVNTNAGVDHDCVLERYCQIWPGATLAGAVRVGAYTYVGTGAAVIPGIAIGADVLLGAGAAVVKDIPARSLSMGVPARSKPRNP